MRTDAFITVLCDSCAIEEIIIQLTATARGGYDERNVNDELKSNGWIIAGQNDYCEACAEEMGLT